MTEDIGANLVNTQPQKMEASVWINVKQRKIKQTVNDPSMLSYTEILRKIKEYLP